MNTTPQSSTAATVAAPRKQSPWRRVVSDFLASKTAVFGLAWAVEVCLDNRVVLGEELEDDLLANFCRDGVGCELEAVLSNSYGLESWLRTAGR